MAKIVTITNPLTGQPVQVDQLEHTAQQIDDGIDAAGIESIDYPGCYYRMVGGVVEWFNPPMLIDKEYRTTERYMGKPVYAKAIDFGELPNNSAKAVTHGISNMDICFMVYGHDTANKRPIPTLCLSGNFDAQIGITTTDSDVVIRTTYDARGDSAIVVMKYTKTAD